MADMRFWLAKELVEIGFVFAIISLIIAAIILLYVLAMAKDKVINGYRKWRWRDRGYHWDNARKEWRKPWWPDA